MIQKRVLPLGDWQPDAPDLGTSGITALNVIPWKGNYKSFPSPVIYSTALTARCQGGYVTRDSSANIYNYAGDATKLYRLLTQTQTDATRTSGGAYATAIDDWWEFTAWGQTVVATNYVDVPQKITLGASNFTALGGTPPKARHVGVVRDFMMFGNVNYGGTAYPNRVYWSAINNNEDYTIAAATQCDIQDFQGDGGWVQKVVGGPYGLIFCERSIYRATYVGTPEIFSFDYIERSRGALAAQSVVSWGGLVFFIADDGFYAIGTQQGTQPIGDGKVDKFFLNDLQTTFSYRINATIDPNNKIVMWAYPGAGAVAGKPNRIILYNWVAGKWGLVNLDTEAFVRYLSPGYTLEGLDAVSTNIDVLSPSLDSRAWAGGQPSLAAFDFNHKLNTITGPVLNATVDTGEIQLTAGRRSTVSSARPLVDGNAAAVAVRSRNRLADNATYSAPVVQNAAGECPQRSNARYHAFETTTSGDFKFIQGVEATFTADGER